MNRYRLITFILSFSIILVGSYYEPVFFYALPIYLLVSWLYLRGKSYIAIVFGLLLSLFSALSLENISVIYSILGSIPISILALEGGLRGCEQPPTVYRFLGLGPSALYILMVSTSLLVIAVFRHALISVPIVVVTYTIIRSYLVGRGAGLLNIEKGASIQLIRGNTVDHIVRISNPSRVMWRVMPRREAEDGVSLYIRNDLGELLLPPGRVVEIPIRVRGDRIGSYHAWLSVVCIDTLGLSCRDLHTGLDVVVKPKLSLVLWIAGRVLETYGGRGELEPQAAPTIRLSPARVGLFFGARPFVQGGEPRHIHFKKSVEHQQLMVKEFEGIGVKPTMLLVDTAVSSPEDLDEVLFKAVAILINYVVRGLGDVGIIVYNSGGMILSLPPMAPINILAQLFKRVGSIGVEPVKIRYVLDEADIERVVASRASIALFEYMVLRRRFDGSVLGRVLKDILSSPTESLRVILLSINSGLRNLYPFLGYILRRQGYEYISELDFEGGFEGDVGSLMALSTMWVRWGL